MPSVGRPSVRATVDSVLASAAGVPIEVIVAWQGSEPPVLPEAVRVVPALAAGVSFARNAGLAAARAPLVAFVDDDEVVEPAWVRATLDAFADPRADAAFGQVLPLDGDGDPYCEIRHEAPLLIRGRRRPPWEVGTGGNMAFRRTALEALGGFDVRLGRGTASRSGEDTDVIARLQARGAMIVLAPAMVVRHPTKSPAEHLASRRPYGRGMGVLTRRDPRLAAHLLSACLWTLRALAAEPDLARAREFAETLRGIAEGLIRADSWVAPAALVGQAPAPVAAAVAGRAVRGLPVTDAAPRLAYACGDDLRLHVSADGLPATLGRIRVAAEGSGGRWVVEEAA